MTDDTSNLNFRNHDLAANIARTRAFMRNQDVLSEYDVNGTVLDQIISVLGEVTEKNAITANALFAESFIDSATIRRSLLRHAVRFGYLPYSIGASRAVVDVRVDTTDINAPSTLVMSKGTVFSGNGEGGLSFTTTRAYSASRDGNTYWFRDVELTQGKYGSVDFVIDDRALNQVYEIDIDDIDTSLMEVYVQRSLDSTDFIKYREVGNSINVDGTDRVYYTYATRDGRYGIQFGDGTFGAKVKTRSIVRVVYFKTAGPAGNGAKEFSFGSDSDQLSKLNDRNRYSVSVVTTTAAESGFAEESSDSIRRNAPKAFRTQMRAVTPSDYADQITKRFPYVRGVTVWNGEGTDEAHDRLGRIYIAAVSDKSSFLTESQKDEIVDSIKTHFGVAGIRPVFVDVSITYINLEIVALVNEFTTLRATAIHDKIKAFVDQYNDNKLQAFGGSFLMSRFEAGVDLLDTAILSNLTKINLSKRFSPSLRKEIRIRTSFNNAIKSVYSNSFTVVEGTKKVVIRAADSGDIHMYEVVGEREVLFAENIGKVNFNTGRVVIDAIEIYKPNDQTNDVRLFAEPEIENVTSRRQNVLRIDSANISVRRP